MAIRISRWMSKPWLRRERLEGLDVLNSRVDDWSCVREIGSCSWIGSLGLLEWAIKSESTFSAVAACMMSASSISHVQ